MQRRDFLKVSGGLSAHLIVGGSLLSVGRAEADTGLPVAALKARLDPKKDIVLLATDKASAAKNLSFNKRTQIAPQLRVIAASAGAVSATILWATENGVGFAVRSGGHSYEGFSQSPDLVIDVRGIAAIKLSDDDKSVSVGSGANLGSVYTHLWRADVAIPAGSCFPVGVAGHSLGGGFGLLGRPFGLACDSILSMEVVDAMGQIRTVSEQKDPDLFWALRGGGNGNFGVVTNFNFRTSAVDMVARFGITWSRSVAPATKIVQAWQQWLRGFAARDHGHTAPGHGPRGANQGAFCRVVGTIRKQADRRVEAPAKGRRSRGSGLHKNADLQGRRHRLRRRRRSPGLHEGKI